MPRRTSNWHFRAANWNRRSKGRWLRPGFFRRQPRSASGVGLAADPRFGQSGSLVPGVGTGSSRTGAGVRPFCHRQGAAEFLPEILRQVGVLYEGIRGIRHAEAVSAVEMTPGQVEELSVRLKALTGAEQIVLHVRVDPSLLGGVRVKVGDVVWDGSLSGRLEELKKKYL